MITAVPAFSLYLHIPYCQSKCPYCDFNSHAVASWPEDDYVRALVAEIERRAGEDPWAGRRLKTKTSERVVPVHPQLIALGFLKYVDARREERERAWLFPTVAPDQKGALSAWSKWWSR